MKPRTNVYVFLFFLISSFCLAQMNTYSKKVALNGVSDQWHKIILPNECFQMVKPDLSDIRIYGITQNDTIEVPYFLSLSKEIRSNTTIPFNLLNSVHDRKGYYYTYELDELETINEIQLNFANINFNWTISLEGSQDQQEWFNILTDYRILSIVNEQTDYSYTNLKFKNSKFPYYRITINTSEKPILKSATILKRAIQDPEYHTYPENKLEIQEENKNTIIHVDLKNKYAVSLLKLAIDNSVDYYRPLTIQYLVDSTKTDKGFHYNYRTLAKRTLSSMEANIINIPSTLTQKFRLIIANNDNQPLEIKEVVTKGYIHTLTARFTKPASYYLVYGKSPDRYPIYDITNIKNNISQNISVLTLGNEQQIAKKGQIVSGPLFKNKVWLWAIITIIIMALGFFTVQMMRKKI